MEHADSRDGGLICLQNGFPAEYTNVTFLEPFDPLFTALQKSFISKQTAAYGNVTHIYTLDQYNENNPYSGDLTYLRNVTSNTIASLKAADTNAIWMIQGWLFYRFASKFPLPSPPLSPITPQQ